MAHGLRTSLCVLLLCGLSPVCAPGRTSQEPANGVAQIRAALSQSGTAKREGGDRRGPLRQAMRVYRGLPPSDQETVRKEVSVAIRDLLDDYWGMPRDVVEHAHDLLEVDLKLDESPKNERAREERFRRLSEDYGFLGMAYYYEPRDYPRSFKYHALAIEAARSSGDKRTLAARHVDRAVVYNYRGEINRAIADWGVAARLFREAKSQLGEAFALSNLGSWLIEKGDLEEGRAALVKSRQLADAQEPVTKEWQRLESLLSIRGDCLASLADYHRRLGRPQEALKYLRLASRDCRLTSSFRYIMYYAEMADIYSRLGGRVNDRKAEELFELALLPSPVNGDGWNAMHTRVLYGGHLARRQRYREAIALIQEGLIVAREHSDFGHQAACLLGIGHALLDKRPHDPRGALARFDECRRLVETSVPIPDLLWRMQHGRGRALSAMGRRREAAEAFEKATEIIDRWLRGVPQSGESPVRMDLSYWEPYEAALGEYYLRGDVAKAHRVMEQLKGGLLASAFNDITSRRELTADERADEKSLRLEVQDARNALSQGKEKAENLRRAQEETLRRAEAKYRSLLGRLYVKYPELRAARGDLQPTDLTSAKHVAESTQTTFVSYVVAKPDVYALVIDGRGADLIRLPGSLASLQRSVSALEAVYRDPRGASSGRFVSHPRVALPVYRMLVEPLEKRLTGADAVCIIPDGILWRVPFELLWRQEKAGPRYLVERFPITYAPSVAAFAYVSRRSRAGMKPGCRVAALVNPAYAPRQRSAFSSRTAALRRGLSVAEVKVLREHLNATVISGHSATISGALEALAKYPVVHFGCHGFYDDVNPLNSVLALEQDLTAARIARTPIRADLVVMAACETGRGHAERGQGLIGLTWATLVGGARSCVSTRWQVDDAATARLFDEFYRELRAGKSKRRALQAAQVRMLKDPSYKYPFFWAGVMLMGH
jgi:CHAT domain-containing protein